MKKLSILIPVFNEERTIFNVLQKVTSVSLINDISKEIVIVDDYSTDNTRSEIKKFIHDFPEMEIIFLEHQKNKGKGAAIRTGIERATGDYIIIQDADLEYDPNEINRLLQPIVEENADVVLGSRFLSGSSKRVLYFWHSLGNKFLTLLSNFMTDLNLSDMEVGYKLIPTSIFRYIKIRENRFGFEPEVVGKLAAIKGIRIYEVGISYHGRTYEEGKKINWKDGFRAIYCIFRYAPIFNRRLKNYKKDPQSAFQTGSKT